MIQESDKDDRVMRDLYIIGAGGFGREVAWLVERINEIQPMWNLIGFIDDNRALLHSKHDDYEVVGDCDYLKKRENVYVVCAIGNSSIRERIIDELSGSNVKFATLIDPSVLMSDRTIIGEGTIVCAGSIITVDVKIGNHVIINLDCTLGHDSFVDDYSTVYPSVNISGNVNVGKKVEIGTGTQIIQGISVCDNTIIGAGAVVVNNCPNSGVYVGCPAKMK